MNVKYPLIALLAILFSVHSYAQEEIIKKNSLGITTDFDFSSESSFIEKPQEYLISMYVNRKINSRFSLGLNAGFSREKVIYDDFGLSYSVYKHYGLELFSRVVLYNTEIFNLYARPMVGYQLSNIENYSLFKAGMDLGFACTLAPRLNLILEKEIGSYNSIQEDYRYRELIYFNSIMDGICLGFEFEF